jgi:hypothetical protein
MNISKIQLLVLLAPSFVWVLIFGLYSSFGALPTSCETLFSIGLELLCFHAILCLWIILQLVIMCCKQIARIPLDAEYPIFAVFCGCLTLYSAMLYTSESSNVMKCPGWMNLPFLLFVVYFFGVVVFVFVSSIYRTLRVQNFNSQDFQALNIV